MTAERLNSAIAKAFAIIEQVIEADDQLSLNEISEGLDLSKPTVHRMLLQLEEAGLITRGVNGKTHTVGQRLLQISLDTMQQYARSATVRDILHRLVSDLGETCNLGVLDADRVLYLERVECDKPLRMFLRAGSRVPLHATATGKLLLAFMPEAKRKALIDLDTVEQLTPHTLTGDALRRNLDRVRKENLSVNKEESMLGLAGVAVPVRAPAGRVIAGLAIHAPISRFGEAEIAAAKDRLKEAAHEIEQGFSA